MKIIHLSYRLGLLICAIFISSNLFATDSLFLVARGDYQLYLNHKVESAETFQSLSNLYQLTDKELSEVNWDVKVEELSEGMYLKIPMDSSYIIRNPAQINEFPFSKALYYQVKPGETLYRISKIRLGLSPETVMAWNELQDPAIKPGQILIIGWYSNDYYRKYKKESIQREFTIINKHYLSAYKHQKQTSKERMLAGPAHQIDGVKSTEDVVMHRKAKIGSIISIINPMTKHVAFAKVIGRVPNSYERSVQILIPKTLAKRLGALDNKFYVRTRYF